MVLMAVVALLAASVWSVPIAKASPAKPSRSAAAASPADKSHPAVPSATPAQTARPAAADSTEPGEKVWQLVNYINDSNCDGCTFQYNAISCPSSSICFAVGNSYFAGGDQPGFAYVTGDGGATWQAENLPTDAGSMTGISCPTISICYATGGSTPADDQSVVFKTTDGGYTWSTESTPATGGLGAISCAATSACQAIGYTRSSSTNEIVSLMVGTTDGGTTWSTETTPSGLGQLFGLACATVSDCVATGEETNETTPVLIVSTDEGRTWTAKRVPADVADDLGAVACPTTTTCYVGGDGVAVSTNGGRTWSARGTIANGYILAMACKTVNSCSAVGNSNTVFTTTNGWDSSSDQPVASPVPATLDAVGCLTATDCVAGGTEGVPSSYSFAGVIVSNTVQSPLGGALLLGELLGGGFNSCTPCLLRAVANAAQPVNTATGDFWHTFTDISIPGRGDALSLSRTYNSQASSGNGAFGYGWSFSYGISLTGTGTDTITLSQEDGSQERFTGSDGYYSAPPRVQATLVRNSDGTYTLTRDVTQTLTFDSAGQLTSERDLNGETTTLSYASGKLTKVTDPGGRSLAFAWSAGHVVKVTDPMGHAWTYGYNSAGDLTRATSPADDSTRYVYDSRHRMTTMISPRGGKITNHYDSSDRVAWQTDALGHRTSFSYTGDAASAAGGATNVTDPTGAVTRYSYQYGLMMSKTEAFGTREEATWLYAYDPATLGQTAVVNPDGDVTFTSYNAAGEPTEITDPDGKVTTTTYNNFNEPLAVTDADGVTTTYTYSADGDLQTTSTPLLGSYPPETQTTTYAYGDASHPGDMTSMTDPDGQVWSYRYDSYGDRVAATDPMNDTTTYTYDADGEVTATVSPDGNVAGGDPAPYRTRYTYDTLGHLRATTNPLGHTVTRTYDADGDLASIRDAEGHTTTYAYNLDDESTLVTAPDGSKTATTYTAGGQIQDQTNADKGVTRYTYNALGLQVSVADPVGHTTTDTYDRAGNLITSTNGRGQVTTMTYDADGRLLSESFSDRTTPDVSSITYDADGQRTGEILTSQQGAIQHWSWNWNSLGQLTSVVEGSSGTVAYIYDLEGHPTSLTYPNGRTVDSGYDAACRETSVTDWLSHTTNFGYDADSDLTTETFPSSTREVDHFGFDDADQLISIRDTRGSTTLFMARYTRNANGDVTSDSSQPSALSGYGYNDESRVCYVAATDTTPCAKHPTKAVSYSYDAVGSPTSFAVTSGKSLTPITQVFDGAGELCWTAKGTTSTSTKCKAAPSKATTYRYDRDGNRTSAVPATAKATTMTYDQVNRLVSYHRGSVTATYTYNGDGVRMSKTVGRTTTRFAWDLSGSQPLLLVAGSTDYIQGPDGLPLEQISPTGVVRYFHHDQLGSTRLLTGATGSVLATYSYGPYGNLVSSSGSTANQLLYAGQYRDAESGLYYLQARYYDPGTGQFLTVDRMVAETLDPYGYASDDPVNVSDPSGLGYCPDGLAIPFTELCLDNPFSSLQRDEQNFDQNSQALDNTPVGAVIETDPFYADLRDSIYAAQGLPGATPGLLAADLIATAVSFLGPADVLDWMGVDGADGIFAGNVADLFGDKAGAITADNPNIERLFNLLVGGLLVELGQSLFPSLPAGWGEAALIEQCNL